MKVKIVSKSGRIPEYQTDGSAGFDISAFLDEPIIIHSGERLLIPTGLFLQLSPGYEAQVRARSGLSIKNGIGLVNGVGTVDSDYRGELLVPLINWSSEDFTVKDGMRIAQVVISKYEHVEFEEVSALDETSRGEEGFGHTGV